MTGFQQATGKIGHMWRKQYAKCATSTLRFQSYSNNLIGLLTVGSVIGTGVTITDYVIEWRVGSTTGAIQLITGSGSDTAIQALHPVVSEPVEGGVLYPVIRYIVIDGIRYSPYFMQGQYSPDLINCLPAITVVIMNCSNGVTGTYSHTIQFNINLNPANNAERTLKFLLNTDGTTKFFAYYFNPDYVADRLTISYVHANDVANPIVLSDWIVGYNATTNYSNLPRIWKQTGFRNVIGINETYGDGDYLLIKITPRVQEPAVADTKWLLYLKCLTSFAANTNDVEACRTINPATVSMTWDAVNCKWDCNWRFMSAYTYSAAYQTYLQFGTYSAYGKYGGTTSDSGGYIQRKTYWNGNFIGAFNTTCVQQNDTLTVVKSGSTITFTFLNQDDYNRYKNAYNTIIASSNWTNYSSDDSNINHFKYINFYIRVGNTCGDTFSTTYIQASILSTFTLDDNNFTITINLATFTSSVVEQTCNTAYQYTQQLITMMNNQINAQDYSIQTKTAQTVPLVGYYTLQNVYNGTTASAVYGFGIPNPYLMEGITKPAEWVYYDSYMYGFRVYYVYIIITDINDPANNFKIINYLAADGGILNPPVTVYEKANGVQIIP